MATPEFRVMGDEFIARFESPSVRHTVPIRHVLTERQRKVLDYVRAQGSITSAEYQMLCSVKKRQAQKDLTAMVQAGLLTVDGHGPSTRYVQSGVRDDAR